MHLERILQIGVAALVALSTVLLGMGEQNVLLSLAATIIAFAAVYITDVKGWIRLNRKTADALGLGAALLAFVQWERELTDAGLLALLNFVVYVQFVLQLKPKSIATYWLLVALSLIEAAVSTALNESLLFGVLLVVYLLILVGVLTIFYLFRETVAAQRAAVEPRARSAAAAQAGLAGTTPPRILPAFAGHVSSLQTDDAVNRPLARLVANLGGMTVCMACLLFCLVPRAERGVWLESDNEPLKRVVGFSSEVQLGELGAISESVEEVMEVRLEDPVTKEPIELNDEPLFRGVVLTKYTNRRWKRDVYYGTPMTPEPIPAGVNVVRQRFTLRPLDTNVLFSMYPAYCAARRPDVLWDEVGEQMMRTGQGSDPIEYDMLTSAVVGQRMATIVPALRGLTVADRQRLLDLPPPRNGVDPLAGTKALAQRLVRDTPPENHWERIAVLTNHMRDPTNYRYSLGAIERNKGLDPIEDFVTEHRIGHCEYYASAMTLMLRSVGVPARLAIGFKGGDWTGTHYQVRAMHAHAWVEAFLGPEYLPPNLPQEMDRGAGAWLIVDPTVGAGDAPEMNPGSYLVEGFKQFLTEIRAGWRSYVLGMDFNRQQESIYEPVLSGAIALGMALTEKETWIRLAQRPIELISPAYWGLTNGGWFSWRGALAAIVIMLTLLSGYSLARRAARRLSNWRSRRKQVAQGDRVDVEFYRRLEALLAQCDLLRTPSQTQREFALAVGGQLVESSQTKRVAPVARQLVELFYRVRFGRQPLDSTEAVTVEQALSELAGALPLAGR